MKYLIKKGGYYYRPESSGYTERLAYAGLFDEDYALNHAKTCDGVSAIPVSEINKDAINELKHTTEGILNIINAVNELERVN